ncbi:MFS transporter [Rhodococcus erythropolis]
MNLNESDIPDQGAGDARSSGRLFLALIAIIFTALVLRPALTVVGPLTPGILDRDELSSSALGLLTSAPLWVFATLSMLIPRLTRRASPDFSMCGAMSIILLGSIIRCFSGPVALLVGTTVLAGGLCVANVVLPVAARRYYPGRIGFITGLYTALMSAGGGIGVVLALPISDSLDLGWRFALASMGFLAIFAACLWIPLAVTTGYQVAPDQNLRVDSGSNARLVVMLGVFFGTQASFFYLASSWLLPILLEKSVSLSGATVGVGMFSFAGIVTCFVTPTLALRTLGIARTVFLLAGIQLSGALVILFGNGSIALGGAVVLAIGVTGAFSLGFTLFAAKADTSQSAAMLSGRAQTIGYVIAGFFPLSVGTLKTLTGSWLLGEIALVFLALVTLLSGLGSARTPNSQILRLPTGDEGA